MLGMDRIEMGIASPGNFLGDTGGLSGARKIDDKCFHGRCRLRWVLVRAVWVPPARPSVR